MHIAHLKLNFSCGQNVTLACGKGRASCESEFREIQPRPRFKGICGKIFGAYILRRLLLSLYLRVENPEVLWPEVELRSPNSMQPHSPLSVDIKMARCYWSEESYHLFIGHHQRYTWSLHMMETRARARVRPACSALERTSAKPQVMLSLLRKLCF